eukprot:2213014-Rhodomonas_salina.1
MASAETVRTAIATSKGATCTRTHTVSQVPHTAWPQGTPASQCRTTLSLSQYRIPHTSTQS